jgi:beta-glucanase (GH16 family)
LNFCDDCQFTSAKIKTADKLGFMYGRIEARMKTPAGSGMWPAFWMLGASLTEGDTWPDCGEIDILEGKGSEPNRVYGTIHGPGYFGGDGTQKGYAFDHAVPLTSGFNVYAIEWRKNAIDFYFNNNKYYSITASQVKPNAWVFNQEFFLILNLATGGNFEPNIDPTVQTGSLSVDYIRYYSINGVGKLIKH